MTVEIKNIINIFKTSTFRQSGVTFTATLINGILGMAFYVFLARVLGPSDFGLFVLSVTVLALVADIGNFGINTGIVNFVSKYFTNDRSRSFGYLKLGLYSKIVISLVFLILGYLLSPSIADGIFSKPELVSPLRLAFLGVGTTWMFSFTTSYYQAVQKFTSWGVVQIFTNSIRLGGVIVLYFLSDLSLNTSLIFYIVAPFIGFLTGLINISFSFTKEKLNKSIWTDFFSYNKWVAVSGGVSAFTSRADTFILGRLAMPYSIGLYSAANQLVQVIPQLVGAIGTVVAPKFSSFDNDKKMFGYFKKLQLMVMGIAGVMVLSIPIVKIVIKVFFGPEYDRSFGIFVILFVSMLVFLISIPVHNAIIYYYQYPKLFSILSIVNFCIVVPLAYYLTLKYGVLGTPYAMLIGNTINLIVPVGWMWRRMKN